MARNGVSWGMALRKSTLRAWRQFLYLEAARALVTFQKDGS